jgi:Zn-finger nucleic acid-binding protein
MICPRDGAQLSNGRIDGVEVDICPTCDGVWLDPGELEMLWKLNLADIEARLHNVVSDADGTVEGVKAFMRCPRCSEGRLQQITCTFTQPVRIDRCDTCLGFWLDRSELDAVVGEKRKLEEQFSLRRLRNVLHAARRSFRRK